ncbi:hypothetical protein FU976_08055 [Campylobacter jejuni]|nr:hypothetical protein [Campylobacter jejuni]
MSKTRKRNAIHSGIGDNDDLFIKRPVKEDVTEDFRYAARLRGKKRHDTMIYPEIPFEYGVSYTGQTIETYNEKDYKYDVNAHPEKTIGYRIEQTKELPIQRMWEAKACFEAEVKRMNMQYAFEWKGKKKIQVQNEVQYAVRWNALAVAKAISDGRSLFTSANGDFIGYGNSHTWERPTGTYVQDISNTSRFSGIIAKDYYNLENYQAEFDFKTLKADNDSHVDGRDDDIVGMIFKAKDKRNFYMMLWERDDRVKASWRAPDNLEGFDMLNWGEQKWEDRVNADGCKSSNSMSSAAFESYSNNKGWKQKHRRIYKVTNGIMRRVDTTPNSGKTNGSAARSNVKDKGNGKGWDYLETHSIRVKSRGKQVTISIKDSGRWSTVFDFATDWAEGSFGMVNVSQAVRFDRIEIKEEVSISGRVPDSPKWNKTKSNNKNLGQADNYCRSDALAEIARLKKNGFPNITTTIDWTSFKGELRDSSKGTITRSIGQNTNIIVDAGTHTEQIDVHGRVPTKASKWFGWDGVGDKTHAPNGVAFIKANDPKAKASTITVNSIKAKVKDAKTGKVIIGPVTGPLIAHSYNPSDTGKVYTKCYVRCGIVDVTPDNRDYYSGLVVFDDIAKVFKADYAAFFNRKDFINKKATYELLKPVKKAPPKPPPETPDEPVSECLPAPPKPPEEEEEVIQCWDDFDFNGKKLIMWSCAFPIEKTEKLFEDGVFAYQGWVTLDPLASFIPNKWTWYKLMPIEATIDPLYDEIKWAGRNDLDKAPVGTKVIIRTKEWYKAIFPADIVNTGIVNSEKDIISEIPPAPEHYWLPTAEDDTDVKNRMPDHFNVIHYLLDAYSNHPDVVMWYAGNNTLTTDNVSREPEALAKEGRLGIPIILTSNDIDQIVIHCKEDPRYYAWSSGKYIGYGKVNGKRPFFGNGSGKADMVNVSTQVVFFPDNFVKESLKGPFIDIYDKEFPNHPRIKYKLHDNDTLIDFSSDHKDAYIWYSDWYSNWIDEANTYQATMQDVTEIKTPLDLDPTDPRVSNDYDPDNTTIERIEVTSNNPFVKLWIEEDKGRHNGLLGTYYRFPLTSNIYEEEFRVKGDYKEWEETYEVKSYIDKVEIPILTLTDYTLLQVTIGGSIIPQSSSNGYTLESGVVKLHGSAIHAGTMVLTLSTGDIGNTFSLEKDLGNHIEVYVNGALLDPGKYSIDQSKLTIDKSMLRLRDWVNIQSYEMNDLFDPTKRTYLGEKKYTQLDFQEDVPSAPTNPNYNDLYYEGSFAFNWGYKAPDRLLETAPTVAAFKPMFAYPEKVNFKFNVDMEVVYPVGEPIDLTNFTGEWKQWDVDPILAPSGLDGPGDWHGPPEAGFPEVTNLRNQTYHSGWYNPAHKDLTDYNFKFKVSAKRGDDDMYGAIFKFDPVTQNFYSFEWDGYFGMNPPSGGTGVRGMAIYKNICANPQASGVSKLNYTRTRLAHAEISWLPGTAQVNEIKVSTIGNTIKVWTNDILRFNIKDENNPFLKGAWGPVTVSQPDTYFWDFWIQTYKRVTYQDHANFRKPYTVALDRPLASSIDGMVEIQVDPIDMNNKFKVDIDAFLSKTGITREDLLAVDYLITEDTSEHSVYFKEGGTTRTGDGTSRLFSNVRGQNAPPSPPVEKPIVDPGKPEIPLMDIPTDLNPRDGFTISWNGYIYAPETGMYRFKVTANDGFRLWIRNTEIISEWHVTGDPTYFPEYEASIYLEGGKWHPITAHYFDNVGQALIRLQWAQPDKTFRRISPDYLTPYLGYRLFAQVKKARPLPWHPLAHNGYYYHEEREKYLYAKRITHKKTPDTFHEIFLEPRPQQGSPIIVRDNEGNNLRKVTFFDENFNLTLENKEEFNGNGFAKYYMNYKGIDKASLKVKVNGQTLLNSEYIFMDEESSIEFMERINTEDLIEVKYKLLYSYMLDMNTDIVNGFVNRDAAKIRLHSSYDPLKMKNMEIIYESAKETPFYQAAEVTFNPILNHNHTGFLYITETEEQDVKDLLVYLSDKTLSNTGREKVLLTARVLDKYNNPVPNKLVKITRDGILVKELTTNDSGEVYFYDQPTVTTGLISVYKAECEGIIKETLLNYYVDNRSKRLYLDVIAPKLSVFGGTTDVAVLNVTLRDENWNPVGEGYTVTVEKRDTYNVTTTESLETDSFGQVKITVSGMTEKHGNMMIKVTYDMSTEETANIVQLKVIGG